MTCGDQSKRRYGRQSRGRASSYTCWSGNPAPIKQTRQLGQASWDESEQYNPCTHDYACSEYGCSHAVVWEALRCDYWADYERPRVFSASSAPPPVMNVGTTTDSTLFGAI